MIAGCKDEMNEPTVGERAPPRGLPLPLASVLIESDLDAPLSLSSLVLTSPRVNTLTPPAQPTTTV